MTERETEPREQYEPKDWSSLYEARDDDPALYERDYKPIHPQPAWRSLVRKLWAPIAAIAFLLWKLKFVFVAVFKFKIFTVAGSMLVSIAAYALLWGWQFAVGFVVLLFVHELGHVLEAKRQGLPVSAPLFIPFLGAMITLKRLPDDAWREAKVALAGPIVGSAGAAVVWVAGEALDSELLVALAFTGFFLNLFNLLPIVPLDGGRAAAAIHPALWLVGMVGLVGLLFVFPNPILILILVLGGLDAWRRWRERREPAAQAYYRIRPWQRVATGVTYLALATVLVLAMGATFTERDL
ncbi:MAG: site-2 protease family protein [Gaiellaceae bacterium]